MFRGGTLDLRRGRGYWEREGTLPRLFFTFIGQKPFANLILIRLPTLGLDDLIQ
jgi:hypothetical protein